MNETRLVLFVGVVAGVGMLAWAVSGVISGRIAAKDYGGAGREHGWGRRYVSRAEEPGRFWALCITYGAVGAVVLLTALVFLVR